MTNKTRSGYIPVKVGHNKKIKIFDRFTSVKKQSKRVLKTFFFNRKKESIASDNVNVSKVKNDRKKNEITKKIKEAQKAETQKDIIYKSSKPRKKNKKLFLLLILFLILTVIITFFLVDSNVFNIAEVGTGGTVKNEVAADKPVVSDIVVKINNTKIYFHPNSDKLLTGELTKLDLIVSHLNESPEDVLIIMGHEHKVGLGISRGVLSKNRAIRIQNILLSKCSVRPNFKIEFYGNKKLAIINARTYDEKIKNRRVEFRITASE